MVSYPAGLDALDNPTDATYLDDPGFELDVVLSKLNDIAEALEAKLGTGASTAAANTVLRGTGAGATAFGQVQTGDLAANAVTKVSRALGSTASPTLTSASGNATIPEMSVTVDVPAGADVIASLTLNQTYNVPAGGMACSFWIDESVSGAVSPTYNTRHFTSGTDGGQALSITHAFTAMAGGTYTFRGRWAVPAGTQTLTGTSRELAVQVIKR